MITYKITYYDKTHSFAKTTSQPFRIVVGDHIEPEFLRDACYFMDTLDSKVANRIFDEVMTKVLGSSFKVVHVSIDMNYMSVYIEIDDTPIYPNIRSSYRR